MPSTAPSAAYYGVLVASVEKSKDASMARMFCSHFRRASNFPATTPKEEISSLNAFL